MTQPIPQTAPDFDRTRLIERPSGFFWTAKDNLQEAERELGIAEFVDPETGEPAEEERPRLEEH